MRPIIDNEKCNGCWECLDVCPTDAIIKRGDTAYISVECMECGACVPECPNDAIYYEEVFIT